MMPSYDVAVVGLGAVGSAAAFHSAELGMRVIGFDRFDPPHVQGSTHGGSRIVRKAYFEGDVFLPLLERAYRCWRKLEEDCGEQLLHLNGCVTVAPTDASVLRGATAAARSLGIPHERLDAAQTAARYPVFHLREGESVLFEPEAGWIEPEAAVRAHLDGARLRGAVLRTGAPIRSWRQDGDGLIVETDAARFAAGALILCAGGWLAPMLPLLGLPLALERQVNVWYRPAERPRDFDADRCPVFIWAFDGDRVLYGVPDLGRGIKAGLHHAGASAGRPEEIDRSVHSSDVEAVTNELRRLLPEACGSVVRKATCFYTNTPDRRFVIDVHPQYARVAFASACSGHGFKVSSAVGENLALLAAGSPPSVDLSPYRAERFMKAEGT